MDKNLKLQLHEAYCTLWQAVEDGSIDNDTFFKLRETFRNIQELIEDDDKSEKEYPAILKKQNS